MKKWKIGLTGFSVVTLCAGAIAFSACKHEHSFSAWETVAQPTCTQSGEQKRVCACGEEEREALGATGHNYSEWTTSATEHKKVCKNGCGAEAEKGAHSFGTDNACTVCGYGLEYTAALVFGEVLGGDGETVVGYTVSGCGENPEKIVVPAYYEGLPVTAIGDYAFYRDTNDSALKSVLLPESVTRIGMGAFYECAALEEIDLGKIAEIGDYAFYKTGIRELVVPESLTSVGKQSFRDCGGLETVTFYGAPAFKEESFRNCIGLKKIYVERNDTAFLSDTFYSVTEASVDVVFSDGVTKVAAHAMGGSSLDKITFVKSVSLGKNIKEIGDSAFQNCNQVTEFVLPEGLETVGETAFSKCSALSKLTVPKSVKTFGAGAFSLDKVIQSVYYSGTASEWAQIDFGNSKAVPFQYGAAMYLSGSAVRHIEIEGIGSVKKYAFYGADVTEVTLGKSVKKVEQEAFALGYSTKKKQIDRVVILSTELASGPLAFNNTLAENAEVFYCGSAAQMEQNVTYGGVVDDHYFKNCKHYFYSESPETETAPTPDSTWQFGGFWKFASDGKTIEKTERK